MQGCSIPSLLPMRKKPVLKGDEEGLIKPVIRDLFTHISMDFLFGVDKLHRPVEGSRTPGRRSIAQSYGQ